MQLIEAHRSGDVGAIAELLTVYQRRIYAVCYRMSRNAEEAADLTQEAILKVMDGIDGYSGRSAFSTWVIRVAMNCCLSHMRRERVRRHGSLDEPVGQEGQSRGAGLTDPAELPPGRHVEQAEVKSVLLRALEGLDPQMRAVLVLRDLQDLDYLQIGQVLDLPLGTVKSRLFRARAALREAVETKLDGDDVEDVGSG